MEFKASKGTEVTGADLKRSSLRTKPCSRSGIESAGTGSAREEAERKQAVGCGWEQFGEIHAVRAVPGGRVNFVFGMFLPFSVVFYFPCGGLSFL